MNSKNTFLSFKESRVPWSQIFKSIHVWAIIAGHFACNWVWYMVLTGLPIYFEEVLDFELKEVRKVSLHNFLHLFYTFYFTHSFFHHNKPFVTSHFVIPRMLESLAGCRTMFLFTVSCNIGALERNAY